MNSLFKSILRKYPDVSLNVQCVVSHGLYDAIPEVDIKREVNRRLAYQLALELLDKKSTVFSSPVGEYHDVLYDASVYALTADELAEILQAAYQAGVDSTKSYV